LCLSAYVFVYDELHSSNILDLTPIVLDKSVADESTKKNQYLSIYDFDSFGLMSVH
jgi:hypothetical protein